MSCIRTICLVLVAACGSPAPKPWSPAPEVEGGRDERTALPRPRSETEVKTRQDLAVGESPMSLIVSRGTLYWTDSLGSIWSMPAHGGGTPTQLSDHESPSFAFRLFTAGDQVLATSRKDLLRVESPTGPVRLAGVKGLLDNPEEATGGAGFAYLTVFKRNEILRVDAGGGGTAKKLTSLPRGVLGVHGDTLYAASYSTGVLIAIPADGAVKTLARGFIRPTAVAADATHVFVYSEKDRTLTRVDIATGELSVLARDLVNSDDLLVDGPWIYVFTWGARPALLRIAKDGSRAPQVIADDLKSPYRIAADETSIYVTSRDQNTIVKLAKSALPAP
ncbi:MAG: hypothetical protein H0T42_00965 [Deltaproteobacteria bacterium]|nr:hypothetical protein [Deltaproteobacteria bacterium]